MAAHSNAALHLSIYTIAMYLLSLERAHYSGGEVGNSLVVRLPAAVVDALDLKEAATSKSALRARARSK